MREPNAMLVRHASHGARDGARVLLQRSKNRKLPNFLNSSSWGNQQCRLMGLNAQAKIMPFVNGRDDPIPPILLSLT